MCQRRQKSLGEVARYGILKFVVNSIPNHFEVP